MGIGAVVREVVNGKRRPHVVGGDCTVLLGVLLGLPRGMRIGFADGHVGQHPHGEH